MSEDFCKPTFHLGMTRGGDHNAADCWHQKLRSSWYFTREEMERNSPTRKDGIDPRKESQLRKLYCSFLRDVGIRLRLPQVTIATAIMFCHRFYLHQSHKKNEWQTVATACLFLSSKVEESPCGLGTVVVAAYDTMYRKEPDAARRIHQKDVLEKQKALILIGERLLLSTIRFDFNVQHPYKPLIDAIRKLGITKDVRQAAWNYVNDWICSTLCLQHKPHYIAAGSLYLAAKHHNLELPSRRGYVWWHEFDVNPQQLEVVICQMTGLLENNRRQWLINSAQKPVPTFPAKSELSSSPDTVLVRPESSTSSSNHDLDGGGNEHADHNEPEISGSSNTDGRHQIVSDGMATHLIVGDIMCPLASFKHSETSGRDVDQTKLNQPGPTSINVDRIKALIKKRKREKELNNRVVSVGDSYKDSWIERELEMGIELEFESAAKKQIQAGL